MGGLQGCLVSVTGVAFEERAKICAMVQDLGGIYSPELKPKCSHLIFEDLPVNNITLSQSQGLPIKVQYALKWDIPVVSKDWIYACHRERILLEEDEYPGMSKSVKETEESLEVLPVKLNEIREDTPSFLQGCHVYLNGDSISSQRLAVLKRLVLAAGGVRYTDLDTSNLTHIVIHNQLLPNNLKVFLEQEEQEIKIVHDGWLFDSFKEARKLSEADYEVSNNNKKKSLDIAVLPAQKWKSAFANQNTLNNSNNSSFLNANANISFGNPRTSLAGGEEFLAMTPNVIETAAKVLKGKRVCFDLASENKRRKLGAKARRCEMKIVEESDETDWCITEVLMDKEDTRVDTINMRNEIWFEAALDSKSQLPSMSFARPFHCANIAQLNAQLNKFIFSQSGFSGPEREFYTELIKSSGAQYTDSLSKANTHLLIEEPRSGSKYEFARKWGIECVGVEWFRKLFASIGADKENDKKIDYTLNADNTLSRSQPANYNKPQALVFHSQLSRAQLSFQSAEIRSNSMDVREQPASLFKGLVFSSSQRLWHRRDELSALIESLGGVFLWSFDRSCTHYLHQGKLAEEAFKEFKQARQWEKFIVSPWWVAKCKEKGERVEEARYPHTYKEEDTMTDRRDTTVESATHFTGKSASTPIDSTVNTGNLDWDAIMAERRAQESLLRPGSKTFNFESHLASVKSQTGSLPSTRTARYRVVFSGYTNAEKTELVKLVEGRIDLEVHDGEHVAWNPRQTLLICNTVNFTEKVFSACATGCWILKKEFLTDKASVSDLEKYELGPAWNANERETLTGSAPKYWRQRLSGGQSANAPFYGWKCAMVVDSSRQLLFESVLRNGGAELISVADLLSSPSPPVVSHVFCTNTKSIPEELGRTLKANQIFLTKHITDTIFRLND